MGLQRPPESSPLFNKIYDALVEHEDANGIRISIQARPRRFDNKDGTCCYMKVLCWNLTADGMYVGPDPALALVGEDHTEASLLADLEQHFPGYQCVVDNEIHLEGSG